MAGASGIRPVGAFQAAASAARPASTTVVTPNRVVTGVNVGAQSYWDSLATMLNHTKGVLIMTPRASMVLIPAVTPKVMPPLIVFQMPPLAAAK